MVTGMHVIFFSRHADKVREFLADVLQLRSVDAGDGWPIFAAPPAEIAVHPTEGDPEHEVFLMCDDIAAFVAQLEERGVKTEGPISDRGWGLLATLVLPGGERMGIYEPRHPSPLSV
jgi:hypothetical protein